MHNVLELTRPGGWPEGSPPRSVLFNVRAYGRTGVDRESLASYFCRLAAKQGVTPGLLTAYIVGPAAFELLKINPQHLVTEIQDTHFYMRICGPTKQSEDWVKVLSLLTRREDLDLCTLIPFRGFISTYQLQSKDRRCCTACYADDMASERALYDRLLWQIDAVKACPIHKIRLLKVPKESAYIRRPGLPDNNREAAAKKFLEGKPKQIAASADELYETQLVVKLLDDAVHFRSKTFSPSTLGRFLEQVVTDFFDGTAAYLAEQLGVHKGQLHGWQNQNTGMSLPRLILLSRLLGCNISDILRGKRIKNITPAHPKSHTINKNKKWPSKRHSVDEIRNRLKKLIECNSSIDASSASKTLGISRRYLRTNFPSENAQLVQQGEHARRESRRAVVEEFSKAYFAEHEMLVQEGIYPSRTRVLARLNGQGKLSYQKVKRIKGEAHIATGIPIAVGRNNQLIVKKNDKK